MKDPIWESYTDEELMAEYYAHLFFTSKTERDKFEANIEDHEDIYDWLDKQIAQNAIELAEIQKSAGEGFSYKPSDLGVKDV